MGENACFSAPAHAMAGRRRRPRGRRMSKLRPVSAAVTGRLPHSAADPRPASPPLLDLVSRPAHRWTLRAAYSPRIMYGWWLGATQLLPFHYRSINTCNGTAAGACNNCKDNGNAGGSRKGIHRRDLAMAKTAGWLTKRSSGQPKTLTGLLQNEDSYKDSNNHLKREAEP